ncbi:MAG TPA: polysaccharide deacetylase family protein [Conexibacter sp.]
MPGTPPHILRRRIVALLALVAAVAVVVAVIAKLAGGGGGGGGTTVAGARTTPGSQARAGRRAASRPAVSPTAGRDMGRPGPPRPVPILMYHVTGPPPPNAPYPDLYVDRAEFEDQMEALKAAGFVAVTEQEVWDSWHRGGPLPARAVVVSVDDGYHTNWTNAVAVLRRLGWPGVLNLKVGNLHEPTYGLTPGQVRAMVADGWEVDSHTINHPDLTTVDAARLQDELVDSRKRLQRAFRVPVNFFCYPAGRYNDAVIAAVRAAGYLAATTESPGLAQPADSPFTLNRVRVNRGVAGATLVDELHQLGA